MKKTIIRLSSLTTMLALTLVFAVAAGLSAQQAPAGSPVDRHGQLKVAGNRILDQHDQPVQLRGMSMYWSMGPNGRNFYNADAVKYIASEWNASLVRAAMGVETMWGTSVANSQAGYLVGDCSGRDADNNCISNKTRVIEVIRGALEAGIYVIIDWHSHAAHTRTDEAVTFFKEMADAYKDYPNIIYEIYNEPRPADGGTWPTIKPYMQAVINAIREIDRHNLILVGTPQWCQNVDVAAASPVDGENLAYVMHFYAGTHNTSLRNATFRALRMGKAVFVSEFGTVNSDGSGEPNIASSDIWMDFMDQFNLSWANWSLSNLVETSAALRSGTPAVSFTGGWNPETDLKASGKYIYNRLINPPSTEKSFALLTTTIVGQGTVTPANNQNQVYHKSQAAANVGLKAVPASGGWSFAGWSVNGETFTTDSITIPMNGATDKNVIATFTHPTISSTLPARMLAKSANWSVKRTGSSLYISGPSSGKVMLYDTRGRIVRSFSYDGGMASISKVPAGNYLMVVKSKLSGQEIFRTKILMY